jgi:hypothetical protein
MTLKVATVHRSPRSAASKQIPIAASRSLQICSSRLPFAVPANSLSLLLLVPNAIDSPSARQPALAYLLANRVSYAPAEAPAVPNSMIVGCHCVPAQRYAKIVSSRNSLNPGHCEKVSTITACIVVGL